MIKPALVTSVALLSSLLAQVNTEAMRGAGAALGWSGALGGDFGLLVGNSELLTINSSMRVDHRSSWGHNFVAAKLSQGKSGDAEFSNKGFLHARSVKAINEKLFLEGFLQQEYDKSINLSNRQLAGGGVRLKSYTSRPDTAKGRSLSLVNGFGLMWEREVTNIPGGTDATEDDMQLLRSTNYMVVNYKIDDRLALAATGYFQFDTRDPTRDYRVLLESSVNVNITRKLILVITLNLRYDSEPAAGVAQSLDLSVTNGLAFSF
ncbi:MAG: DUF481 domain-containing protein [Candidatus Marinimicrobia bacterium]|nr:DUF481 domain-containing protein [Candidatus Neomarinimicrobiota bacterium]